MEHAWTMLGTCLGRRVWKTCRMDNVGIERVEIFDLLSCTGEKGHHEIGFDIIYRGERVSRLVCNINTICKNMNRPCESHPKKPPLPSIVEKQPRSRPAPKETLSLSLPTYLATTCHRRAYARYTPLNTHHRRSHCDSSCSSDYPDSDSDSSSSRARSPSARQSPPRPASRRPVPAGRRR